MDNWSVAPFMINTSRNHASCALEKFLYVFFGFPYDYGIDRLNVENPAAKWESINNLKGE